MVEGLLFRQDLHLKQSLSKFQKPKMNGFPPAVGLQEPVQMSGSSGGPTHPTPRCRRASEGSRRSLRHLLLCLREDVVELVEQQLHDLALEDHVDGHVGRLGLGAQQRRAEDDGQALHRHPVGVLVLHHPGEHGQRLSLVNEAAACR